MSIPPYGGMWLSSLAENRPDIYVGLEKMGRLKEITQQKREEGEALHERLVAKEMEDLTPAMKALSPEGLRAGLDMRVKEVVLHELGIPVPPKETEEQEQETLED